MTRWELISVMGEKFTDEQMLDMLVRWLSRHELEACIEDYLNDRDMEIRSGYVKDKECTDM